MLPNSSLSTTVVDEAGRCRKTNSWITWGRTFVWNKRSCSFESSYYHYCTAEQTQNRDFSTPKEGKKRKSRCRWVQKRVYKLFNTIMNRSENQETGKGKILYRNWPVMALITCRSRFPMGSWTNSIINQKKKVLDRPRYMWDKTRHGFLPYWLMLETLFWVPSWPNLTTFMPWENVATKAWWCQTQQRYHIQTALEVYCHIQSSSCLQGPAKIK